jgi:Ribonuclease G/E
MKLFWKRTIILTISLILIMVSITGFYLWNRSIHLKNNDLLLTYETLEPVSVLEEKVDNSTYIDYFYGEDTGRIIVENNGTGVVIRDNKHGFIKEYRQGVLYYVDDFKKEELFAEIKSYLSLRFWLGGARVVAKKGGKLIRTIDECMQIDQLIKEKRYEEIAKDHHNEVIITNSGTCFVN